MECGGRPKLNRHRLIDLKPGEWNGPAIGDFQTHRDALAEEGATHVLPLHRHLSQTHTGPNLTYDVEDQEHVGEEDEELDAGADPHDEQDCSPQQRVVGW